MPEEFFEYNMSMLARFFRYFGLTAAYAVVMIVSSGLLYSIYEQVWKEPIRIQPLRARDDIRKQDLKVISLALESYIRDNGPISPTDYGERDSHDWDYSSQGGFMSFLVPKYAKRVPIDPVNSGQGDVFAKEGKGYAYGYYYDADETPTHPRAEYYLTTRLEETGDFYQLSNTMAEINEGQ